MAGNLPQVPQHQQRAGMAAYLLGMGPMPAPRLEDMAVARVLYGLDHPELIELEDNRIDRQLRGHAVLNEDDRVTVRIPVDDKLCRDIVFPATVPHNDFLSRVCAAMDIDPNAAQLGWKLNDEPKRARAHQLSTQDDMKSAFEKVIGMKYNPRRYREVVMEIVSLAAPVETVEIKRNNGRNRELSYSAAVRIVEEKLSCVQHGGPSRWCYVKPGNPAEHAALGREEVNLWARKIHDRDAHPDCRKPPYCLRLDDMSSLPPIHVHIDGQSFASTSRANASPRGLKRRNSSPPHPDDGSDSEPLPLLSIIEELHRKFPKLNFLQYCRILDAKGFFYAQSVIDFDREYFIQLGFREGAVGTFLNAVQMALDRQKAVNKRARVSGEKKNIV